MIAPLIATFSAGYLLSAQSETPVLEGDFDRVTYSANMEIYVETSEATKWTFFPISVSLQKKSGEEYELSWTKGKSWERTRERGARDFTETTEEPTTTKISSEMLKKEVEALKHKPVQPESDSDVDALLSAFKSEGHFPSYPVNVGDKWTSKEGRTTTNYRFARIESAGTMKELIVQFDSNYISPSGGVGNSKGLMRFDEPNGKMTHIEYKSTKMKGLFAAERVALKSFWIKATMHTKSENLPKLNLNRLR